MDGKGKAYGCESKILLESSTNNSKQSCIYYKKSLYIKSSSNMICKTENLLK